MREVSYFGQKNSDITPEAPVAIYPSNVLDANQMYSILKTGIPSSQQIPVKRRMMKWLAPERGIIEMYINPQNIGIKHNKLIKHEKTKGGFAVQYWGEDLTDITISGNTGSSGIEGINVLYDIYRGEQLAFDIVALEEQAKLQSDDLQLVSLVTGLGDVLNFMDALGSDSKGSKLYIPYPTLAYYATSVELYWQGEIYRGFFTSFNVDEKVDRLGLFDYTMNFKGTQRRGYRTNYLPWQHTAVSGPSDHDTVPYSFDVRRMISPQDNTVIST